MNAPNAVPRAKRMRAAIVLMRYPVPTTAAEASAMNRRQRIARWAAFTVLARTDTIGSIARTFGCNTANVRYGLTHFAAMLDAGDAEAASLLDRMESL